MPKPKQPKPVPGGPYLAAAFFCETTIVDKQEAVSAIRLVDQVLITLDPSSPLDFPSDTQRIPVHIKGLLSFKTGDSPGIHKVRIDMRSPSGKLTTFFKQDLSFSSQPHGGANLELSNTIFVKASGLFWFYVFLDDHEMTRMPLKITVERGQPESPQSATGG